MRHSGFCKNIDQRNLGSYFWLMLVLMRSIISPSWIPCSQRAQTSCPPCTSCKRCSGRRLSQLPPRWRRTSAPFHYGWRGPCLAPCPPVINYWHDWCDLFLQSCNLEHDQSGQLSGERAGVDVILGGQVGKSPNINLEEERLECIMIKRPKPQHNF